MQRFGTTTRIAFAMAMWTATVLLMLRVCGVISDRTAEAIRQRSELSEMVAVTCSQMASRDQTDAIAVTLAALVQRDSDVLSAACVADNGEVIAETVGHPMHWLADSGDVETGATQIEVPVYQGDEHFADVQVTFRPLVAQGWLGFFGLRSVQVTLLATLGNLLGFLLLLRRCFRHLDPSRAVPERVRTALDTMAEGIVVADMDGRIRMANQPFAEFCDSAVNDLIGKDIDDLPWVIKEDAKFTQLLDSMASGGRESADLLRLSPSDSDERILQPNASRIIEGEQCHGYMISLADVTSLEQKNQQLEYLATRDPMTGCLNRRSFFEQMETHWSGAERHGHSIGCLMVDVDHFKSINDNFGHAVGDEVLIAVSSALLEMARGSDLVCRYGGEEFCVAMPFETIEGAKLAAQRYRKAIESLTFDQLSVTASLGVSCNALGADSVESMLDQADQALYHSKRTGRNRVTTFAELPEETDTPACENDVQRQDSSAAAEAISGDDPVDPLDAESSLLESVQTLVRDLQAEGQSQVPLQRLQGVLADRPAASNQIDTSVAPSGVH
ncbi:sensor domain-containing diguanylate cyclase [Crateriforma spongiae]|uniref:sensor domain-containing diguanylate cyclase n=1 Tax=Crateriforma spongiae TaxID=2724528 RepID=UPI001446D005|nr:sensor domain-containing diguanylate cyclase [Crateriforma spongiae]